MSTEQTPTAPPTVVADLMTRHVTVLHEEDNIAELEQWMNRLRFRHLPVVDGQRLVGLVTHSDLLRVAASTAAKHHHHESDQSRAEGTFVAQIMQRDVITVGPQTPLRDAARILLHERVGCLPVVDPDKRLLGIVTAQDYLKLALQLLPE